MTGAFRLGLVGAGRMGRTHLSALQRSEAVEVVAVAEPSPASRAALAGLSDVPVHESLASMIAAGGLDGVLIATPSGSHIAMIQAAAAAGLPILCEKPCGLSAIDAGRAGEIAARAGVRLQVAYWRRFVPELRALKRRIDDGQFGKLYHVACFQWDETPPAASFRATGGGAFVDMGVHEFDQIRWLTGQEAGPVTVESSAATFDVEVASDPDATQAICLLSGGTTAHVSLGRRFPPGDACWVQVFGTDRFEESRFMWPGATSDAFAAALLAQAEDFAFACRGGTSSGATADDAVKALDMAAAASAAMTQTLRR
jgi:myo-inositol 2-dehydrogenase/D-chiro-inositol 1-dehydrogenase